MWWLAVPAVAIVGKAIYDAVTEDDSSSSSSSSSSSNYDAQKKKEQQKAEQEAKQLAKRQKKQRLIRQLSEYGTKNFGVIREEYLKTDTKFLINNMIKLEQMTERRVYDLDSALVSLRDVAGSPVSLKKEYDKSKFDHNLLRELSTLEQELTDRLIK
ncbi:hypothetical protein AB4122_01530 [Vibrio cyclitrophicus]|uniref:hypothetical protein n=1 Tax=Vibrio TaxID=662 RepID=UPI000C86694A|nr:MULTISPECIES: hypothetical protein [Vibrio]PMK13830.1 hypothetical protein BCU10_17280 [Vibrio splendidus]PMK21932.1 hypothetical protein BCU04_19525 [Vibrio cyclitrophicus]